MNTKHNNFCIFSYKVIPYLSLPRCILRHLWRFYLLSMFVGSYQSALSLNRQNQLENGADNVASRNCSNKLIQRDRKYSNLNYEILWQFYIEFSITLCMLLELYSGNDSEKYLYETNWKTYLKQCNLWLTK